MFRNRLFVLCAILPGVLSTVAWSGDSFFSLFVHQPSAEGQRGSQLCKSLVEGSSTANSTRQLRDWAKKITPEIVHWATRSLDEVLGSTPSQSIPDELLRSQSVDIARSASPEEISSLARYLIEPLLNRDPRAVEAYLKETGGYPRFFGRQEIVRAYEISFNARLAFWILQRWDAAHGTSVFSDTAKTWLSHVERHDPEIFNTVQETLFAEGPVNVSRTRALMEWVAAFNRLHLLEQWSSAPGAFLKLDTLMRIAREGSERHLTHPNIVGSMGRRMLELELNLLQSEDSKVQLDHLQSLRNFTQDLAEYVGASNTHYHSYFHQQLTFLDGRIAALNPQIPGSKDLTPTGTGPARKKKTQLIPEKLPEKPKSEPAVSKPLKKSVLRALGLWPQTAPVEPAPAVVEPQVVRGSANTAKPSLSIARPDVPVRELSPEQLLRRFLEAAHCQIPQTEIVSQLLGLKEKYAGDLVEKTYSAVMTSHIRGFETVLSEYFAFELTVLLLRYHDQVPNDPVEPVKDVFGVVMTSQSPSMVQNERNLFQKDFLAVMWAYFETNRREVNSEANIGPRQVADFYFELKRGIQDCCSRRLSVTPQRTSHMTAEGLAKHRTVSAMVQELEAALVNTHGIDN